MAISNAVDPNAVARVIGTLLKFLDRRILSQALPIQVAILGPPSAAAEGTVDANKAFDFESAKEVGDAMGYGSPLYRVARMLRPENGGGVGVIRTSAFPIVPTAAALATDVLAINIAGVNPSKNTTHVLKANGRRLPYSVLVTDDVTSLATRIKATLDAALQVNTVSSVVELAVANDIDVTLTALWNGASGNGIQIEIEADDPAGVIYTLPVFAAGAGTFDITAALANFGETWFNVVINACDETVAIFDQLENFNGTPEDGIGRWAPTVMLPFVALYGTLESDKDDVTTISDARKLDLTNHGCPAPGSPGFTFEAAGAWARDEILTASDNPPKSYSGQKLLDMPVPADPTAVGDFADFEGRDFIERKGMSTATLKGDSYVIEDANTHYHPDGITPAASPYFRVVNVLGRAFSVIYLYKLLVETRLLDKILVDDVSKTTNPAAIDPDKWKAIVSGFLDDLEKRAISTKADESKPTIQTGINAGNPERIETSFEVILSSNVRQADSTIVSGFNFG